MIRVLHVLDHSIPLHSGYTFRTAALLREQRSLGWRTFHAVSYTHLDVYKRQARSTRSFFVTENEAALFCEQAPECRLRVEAMCNGVDADYFSPVPERPSPYQTDELPVVFTGAMDYLPNIDAVTWFKNEVLPDVLKRLSLIHI